MTWEIRQPAVTQRRKHRLDGTQACTVCGMPAAAIAAQPGDRVCDGGAALLRRAADRALARAVARSR